MMGGAINQKFALDKQKREMDASANLQGARLEAEKLRQEERLKAEKESVVINALYGRGGGGSTSFGGAPSGGGGLFAPQKLNYPSYQDYAQPVPFR